MCIAIYIYIHIHKQSNNDNDNNDKSYYDDNNIANAYVYINNICYDNNCNDSNNNENKNKNKSFNLIPGILIFVWISRVSIFIIIIIMTFSDIANAVTLYNYNMY